MQCGVPHGSVLGQIQFILYTADVIEISTFRGLSADDIKLTFHEQAHQRLKRLPWLEAGVTELDEWTSSNRLKLNADKT